MLGALRPAGDRRRPGRPCRRADSGTRRRPRHPGRRRISSSAARCCPKRLRSAASQQPTSGETLAELESLPNVRLLPRTTVFGWYDDNVFGAVERVQKHLATPDPQPSGRASLAHRRQAGDPCDRRRGTSARLRRQRHSRCHDGWRHAQLSQPPGGRPRQAHRRLHQPTQSGYRTAADLEAAGLEVAAIVDSRADAPRRLVGPRAACSPAPVSSMRMAARRLHRVSVATASAHRNASKPMRWPCPVAGARSSTLPAIAAQGRIWSDAESRLPGAGKAGGPGHCRLGRRSWRHGCLPRRWCRKGGRAH